MSIGLLLVCVELVCMIGILLFMPRELAGPCFIGFAIGESLGAAALRIGGGIFTKIADIGSDLMKIVFNLPEDDPKNPGVIADCTGDNAGDSVGPTADGFETYGVTGVALIAFLALSLGGAIETQGICGKLIVWIFAIQSLMVLASLGSFYVNKAVSNSLYNRQKGFQLGTAADESGLADLHRFHRGCLRRQQVPARRGYGRGGRCGSKPVVGAGRHRVLRHAGRAAHHGIHQNLRQHQVPARERNRHLLGPGRRVAEHPVGLRHRQFLRVLDGAGDYRADVRRLRVLAKRRPCSRSCRHNSTSPRPFSPSAWWPSVFWPWRRSSLPWTVSGPVTDNAQSIYELSRIEAVPNVRAEIEKDFGFKPDFENAKLELEKGDGAGNTFKATAKPVLIGTAVVGATTMIFGIIMLLEKVYGGVIAHLSLVQPQIILGLLMGGAVIYWFTGASAQAVVTGAYRAVVFIKEHLKLDKAEASIADSKRSSKSAPSTRRKA